MKEIKERFELKVNYTDKCHEWTGAIDSCGYGRISINNKNRTAHTIAYELYIGDRKGLCVCHKCDNPKCVNPEHLFLGTMKDNINDMILKDRGNKAFGSKSGRAKISEKDVNYIRGQNGKITQNELAKIFGIKQAAINKIQTNKTWKHVVLKITCICIWGVNV